MKRYTRILLILLLMITAFHLSGAESAFCDDSSTSQATESHGCMACQPGHHTATVQASVTPYVESPATFFSFKTIISGVQEPSRFILRPPITL